MGIYDRDYSRDHEPGLNVGLPQSITNRLILFTGAVYLVQWFAGAELTDVLSLWSNWYRQPWRAFELLTYGFLHDPNNIAHILGNMFMLWMFGRELEQRYGRSEFLQFYLTAIVVAGLVWCASVVLVPNAPPGQVLGASGGISACIILYAFNFPRRTIYLNFFIPVPIWLFGVIVVLSDLGGFTGRSKHAEVAFAAHLGGAAFGAMYFFTNWLPLRLPAGRGFKVPSLPKRGPALRVHDPDDEDDGDDLQRQVDAILAKIQAQGQDSLTRRERAILEQASRKYREQRGR